eukprot:gene18940-19279_t
MSAAAYPRPSAKQGGLGAEFPLYFISKKNLSHSKLTVTKRVVVVGGSSHSYALLETLCSVSYLNLPNVYLIIEKPPLPLSRVEDGSQTENAEDGGGSSSEESKLDDEYSGCLSLHDVEYPFEQELFATGLIHKVNVVTGSLTDIDRENKAVVVSDEMAIEYDVLVLSTNSVDTTTRHIPSLAGTHPSKCADCGIFSLGNPTADLLALRWVKRRNNRGDPIVVYGEALRAFCCAAKLIRSGIPPNKIVVAVSEESPFFASIDDTSMCMNFENFMNKSDLKVYWGHHVNDVNLSANGFLQNVQLERKARQIDMDEDGLSPRSHQDVFTAINESGLVFDGGLVVDQSFRTVDPVIYGVSNYTRFSRKHKD